MDLPRYRTGDAALDAEIARLVESIEPGHSDELRLRDDRHRAADGDRRRQPRRPEDREPRAEGDAPRVPVFAPYRAARKASIFGSARTREDDPLYEQTRTLAAGLAARGWMVVTGAGPGIMTAGIEGAGPENAFGVSIRLPFEASTSEFLADDPKLVNFQYFFTRKLSFVKESDAFVLLPGGLRHARRGVRDAHADPDREGPARAGRAARRPRRHVLDPLARVRARPSCSTAATSSPTDLDLVLITDDVRSRSTSAPASTPTTTRCASSAATSCCGSSTRPTPTRLVAAQRGVRRPARRRARSPRRARRRARSATATSSTSTGWSCASTATTGPGSRRLIDALNAG